MVADDWLSASTYRHTHARKNDTSQSSDNGWQVFVSIFHLVFWTFPSSVNLLSRHENTVLQPYSAVYSIGIIYEWEKHRVGPTEENVSLKAHLLLLLHCTHWVCLSLLANWDSLLLWAGVPASWLPRYCCYTSTENSRLRKPMEFDRERLQTIENTLCQWLRFWA